MYSIFYESHAGSWAILILLFLASYFLFRWGKQKASKIVYMIVRLFYIIMLVSGVGMLFNNMQLSFIIKGVLAIMLIGIMEVIMGRTKRKELTGSFWIVFAVLLAVVVALGYLKL
ncbi:DUF1516 family protein [Alkalicoccobacillus porphyridii]|uniref:DUF1516 family protein n=1 Tax=Alkalicoccobacillus porphyridii TaxID=2597270 RepID=A0A554A3D2_9BACI|nr:DUF1516 family protein [Alkalicoccobacillus porphyridii]TSB48156.1 DUF1516 family protein [Alkalicoccobacillus porphyridii]